MKETVEKILYWQGIHCNHKDILCFLGEASNITRET